jgi:hypothetical protein
MKEQKDESGGIDWWCKANGVWDVKRASIPTNNNKGLAIFTLKSILRQKEELWKSSLEETKILQNIIITL